MNRILIAGTNSGCGKTTITCAILQALVNRGLIVSSFKCGPDYIDPMFHSTVIGTKAYNLDAYFCGKETLNFLLQKHAVQSDIAVLEGVMGYYDGVRKAASSYQVAVDTGTPVVLVIDCRGMSRSIGAVLKGYLDFCKPSGIAGVIFNRLPHSLTALARAFCEEYGVSYLGYFPTCGQLQIKSRHLGLVTAAEITDLKEKLQKLAAEAEAHLKLDVLLALAQRASRINTAVSELPCQQYASSGNALRIAVARDQAFCFYYEDNLELLQELGAQLIFFSPLTDAHLPEDIHGLLLCGGYPELYLKRLSENKSMLADIKEKICGGLPTIAECGGFMYLHTYILDTEKKEEPDLQQKNDDAGFMMTGVIDGEVYKTEHLQRFGYVELTAQTDNLLCRQGETMKAHEFHYWESTSCGADFTAKKASSGLTYPCIHAGKTLYAGFPHLYFYSNPGIAVNFVKTCCAYLEK